MVEPFIYIIAFFLLLLFAMPSTCGGLSKFLHLCTGEFRAHGQSRLDERRKL